MNKNTHMAEGVSVLTPVLNGAHSLKSFRLNVESQTRPPERILIFNDGSTDGTQEFLNEWALDDQRVQILTSSHNVGRGHARQSLLDAVETTYVSWLDVDDYWHPRKLERQVECFEDLVNGRPMSLIAAPICQLNVRSGGATWTVQPGTYKLADYLELAQRNIPVVMFQSCFGRSEDFQSVGVDPSMRWSEDFDFFLRFLGAGGCIVPQDAADPPAVYRHDIRARDPRMIVDAHDYLYAKNRSLWPADADAIQEKLLRRLGYVLYATVANGQVGDAEDILHRTRELFADSDNDNSALRTRVRRAVRMILNAYRSYPEEYLRFYHQEANAGRQLVSSYDAGKYTVNSQQGYEVRLRVATPTENFTVGDGPSIGRNEVLNLYLEGHESLFAIERRKQGAKRSFVLEPLEGGVVGLLPKTLSA